MKWVMLTDAEEQPLVVLDADGFLRATLFEARDAEAADKSAVNPYRFCHRPIIVTDPTRPLGDVIEALKDRSGAGDDQVIDKDIVLVWGEKRKIITGADILARLLKGIGGESGGR